jgi:hypothetical protein
MGGLSGHSDGGPEADTVLVSITPICSCKASGKHYDCPQGNDCPAIPSFPRVPNRVQVALQFLPSLVF